MTKDKLVIVLNEAAAAAKAGGAERESDALSDIASAIGRSATKNTAELVAALGASSFGDGR